MVLGLRVQVKMSLRISIVLDPIVRRLVQGKLPVLLEKWWVELARSFRVDCVWWSAKFSESPCLNLKVAPWPSFSSKFFVIGWVRGTFTSTV